MDVDDDWICSAGRTAFFGGRWKFPCFEPTEHEHRIFSPGFRIDLCDKHFAEVHALGLITDPYISKEGAEHLAKQRGLDR